MKEIKVNLSFTEWFKAICKLNDIEMDEYFVDENISGVKVKVTPNQLLEYMLVAEQAQDMFAKISMAAHENGRSQLIRNWTLFVTNLVFCGLDFENIQKIIK